jgi:uncharacterized membrane protein YbhN (UPF0104 family)
LLIWSVGPSALWSRLSRLSAWPLAVAAFSYLAAHLIRTARLGVLMPEARSAAGVTVVTSHSFANQLLPARTGEVTFPALLHKLFGASAGRGASYLLVVRFAELTALFAWQSFALGLWWHGRETVELELISLIAVVIAIFGALFFVSRPMLRGAVDLLGEILSSDRIPSWRPVEFCRDAVPDASEALEDVTAGQWRRLVGWSLAMWGAMFVVFAACLSAAGLHLGFGRTVVGATGGIIGNLLSIVGFGSLGMMEAGWTAGYVALGAEAAPVAAAGFAVHAIVIGGSASFAALGAVIHRLETTSER